jgi:hypothetical protein
MKNKPKWRKLKLSDPKELSKLSIKLLTYYTVLIDMGEDC